MDLHTLPYLVPYLISVALSSGVGIYAWRRRAVPGAIPFALMALGQASWTLGYVFELASPGLEAKIFWDNIQWAGAIVSPLAFLAFALQYTGHQLSHPKRTWGLLAVVPVIFMLLVLTDDRHGLLRPDAWLVPGQPFSALVYDFTGPVWILSFYGYGLILSGIFMLVNHFSRSHGLYRVQVGTVIVGTLIPLVGTVLTLMGITLTFHRDTTPLTFAIGNLIIAWGLFRYRLFDVTPVARDAIIENMSDAVLVLDARNRLVDLNPAAQELIGLPAVEIIGRPIAEVLPNWVALVEQYRDVEEAHTEVAVGVGARQRHFDLKLSPLRARRSCLAGRLIVLRDITQRKQREAELSTLLEAARAISSPLDLKEILARIAEQMVQVTGVSGCTFSRWDQEADAIVTWVEWRRQWPEYADKPGTAYALCDYPATRTVLENGQPITILATDPDADPAEVALLREMEATSLLMLPLTISGRVVGLVELDEDERERVFTPAEIRLCQALADQAAVAIENARLYQQAQVVAVDEERQRLARELHDSVTQSLYSLTLLTNGWETMAAQGRLEDAAGCFRQLGEVGQQALKEMRLLIHQLRPPILEEVGLAGALQQRLDTVERRVNVETRLLTQQGTVDQLPRAVEEQLLHIAQEALNNTLRHADATAITVRIRAQDGRVALSVEDNGTGFDRAAVSSGMGFVTMKERAEAVGGRVWVASRPDRGTTVTVTIPIRSDEKV